MLLRPPRSTPFPSRRSSDLRLLRDRRGGQPRAPQQERERGDNVATQDRKSKRLNSSHRTISYAVFCLKKKNLVSEAATVDKACDSRKAAPLVAYRKQSRKQH